MCQLLDLSPSPGWTFKKLKCITTTYFKNLAHQWYRRYRKLHLPYYISIRESWLVSGRAYEPRVDTGELLRYTTSMNEPLRYHFSHGFLMQSVTCEFTNLTSIGFHSGPAFMNMRTCKSHPDPSKKSCFNREWLSTQENASFTSEWGIFHWSTIIYGPVRVRTEIPSLLSM